MPEPWEDPREEARDLMRSLSAKFGNGFRFQNTFLMAIAGAIGVLLLFSSFYTVEPSEEAVILRFGRYVSTEPPGLHFKLPLVDQAIKVKTKIILQEEFGFRSSNRTG